MKASKPLVAVGPKYPLEEDTLMADYFRMSIRASAFINLVRVSLHKNTKLTRRLGQMVPTGYTTFMTCIPT